MAVPLRNPWNQEARVLHYPEQQLGTGKGWVNFHYPPQGTASRTVTMAFLLTHTTSPGKNHHILLSLSSDAGIPGMYYHVHGGQAVYQLLLLNQVLLCPLSCLSIFSIFPILSIFQSRMVAM